MVEKLSRKAAWAAGVFGVGFATVCLAQAVNPNNPASVKAWQTSNNIQEKTTNPPTGWQSIAAVDQGMLMRGVLTPRNSAGQTLVGLRIEFFAPAPGVGGIQSLSELDTFLVDCTGNRMRQVERATFPQHNLGGDKKSESLTEASPDGAWGPTAGMDVLEGSVRAGCASTAGGGAQVAAAGGANRAGPPFNRNDNAAGRRWINDQHIEEGSIASELLGFGQYGAMYRSADNDKAHAVSLAQPRYIFRQEYYGPKPLPGGKTALSMSSDYDINCRARTFRIVAVREYAARNLAGDAVTTDTPNAAYVPIDSDAMIKDVYDDICTGDSGGNLGRNRANKGRD